MLILMPDFLVDEYMESVVVQLRESDIMSLQQMIKALCQKSDIESCGKLALPHQDEDLTLLSSGTESTMAPGRT